MQTVFLRACPKQRPKPCRSSLCVGLLCAGALVAALSSVDLTVYMQNLGLIAEAREVVGRAMASLAELPFVFGGR